MTPTASVAKRLRAAGCVFAGEEADVLLGCDATPPELEAMIKRRVAGEPLEHIVGWAAFAGLRVPVDPGVFVPRHRSELIASEAIRNLPKRGVLVELCCGTAAVSAAVIRARPEATVHAADLDPAAVWNARKTFTQFGGRTDQVYRGDLYRALPEALRRHVDVIVANAPYVPTSQIEFMPSDARVHEPRLALDGGVDGLDVARRLLADASGWLRDRGAVLFEVGEPQAAAATQAVEAVGLNATVVRDPDLDAVVIRGAARGRRNRG